MTELIYPNATRLLEPTTPDDPRWHALRKIAVGASEAAPLMGEGYKGTNAHTVWEHKVSDEEQAFSESTLKLFDRGHKLEPVAAQLFTEENPTIELQEEGLLRSTINPYMTCTPDRITNDNGGLEIKTAGLFATKKFTDQCPRTYYWQAVQNLFITGRDHWYVFALHPDSFNTWTWMISAHDDQVKADMELLNLTILDFWESYVLTRTPPEGYATFNPPVSNEGTDISTDQDIDTYLALLEARRALADEIKQLTDEKAQIDDTLKYVAGDKSEVNAGGEVLWTYKESVRTGIDAKRFQNDHPDLFDKYKKETRSRSLHVPKPKRG